ncbi:hypothetical protein [Streptomyces microflavus]|uniref:hypothetical protein n=1 Tax=Streptomyces microflavus TaxID=1919 RepID=UPI003825AD04
MRTGQWTGCTRRPARSGFPQQLLQDVNLTTIENLALELERWARASEQGGDAATHRGDSRLYGGA